jgi:hypothetical protein
VRGGHAPEESATEEVLLLNVVIGCISPLITGLRSPLNTV